MNLDALSETVREAGAGMPLEVYARRGQRRGLMGVESSLLLSFVMGAVGSGFLTDVGKDTWAAIKKIAAKALGGWTAPSPMEVELVLTAGETTVVVSGPVRSDRELETLLIKARQVFDDYSSRGSVQADPSIEVEVSKGPERVSQIRSAGERLSG